MSVCKTPAKFYQPLAIGAPAPFRQPPVRLERMIHFVPPHNEKIRAKLKDTIAQVDVVLGNLEDAIPSDAKVAARQGFISPESFTFMESAVVLAIVVLGGMGSQVGVAIAAVAMIGGTEILRELDWLKDIFGPSFDPTQYRMLVFGLAMVLLMVWRPRGLISFRQPSIFLREKKPVPVDIGKAGAG